MNDWYSITPTGPITLGNLAAVGQNSGQVGCRWPPNGHHLAAALALPQTAQLWGPFWFNGKNLFVPMPQTVYTTDQFQGDKLPQSLYRMQWRDRAWHIRPEHQEKSIEQLGGRFLIATQDLGLLWKQGKLTSTGNLQRLPWQILMLSHNHRENYQVMDEGGFFAEMTTLMNPGWSLLVRILGGYTPPPRSSLGAGRTPVVIAAERSLSSWDSLGASCPDATGAILLTGALWSDRDRKSSVPYPPQAQPLAYAADLGQPWQTWKFIKKPKTGAARSVLTPGEWLTPAGAVYLWDKAPVQNSGPLRDPFHRDALGYGHLWLFKETQS